MMRKKTVSKNTGIDNTKPLINIAHAARSSPSDAMSRRTILSAAPLSIMHMPMIAAIAITKPIPPTKLPKPIIACFTALPR